MDEASIFLEALQRPSPEERAAFLDQACADNQDLRDSVELLLRAHAKAADFLAPPRPRDGDTVDQPNSEDPGLVIGPYKLIERIGEGGMGTVWMAQQTEPVKRLVALKLIKAGMDSKEVIARFEAERQALALMDHPNIARVLDAGTTRDGRPYFVMDLVKGVPITRYCDEHYLTPRQRLELFLPVCQAVQHAHQKGVIHRDLKPSNVLIALYDGKPVPKAIDFGVAKAAGQSLTEKTLVTGFGAVVGTPEYMSPEQAEVNNQDIDTRSDIYSLGVLLYELLTGSTPLTKGRVKEAALLEVLRVIREEEPPRPSTRLSSSEELPSISAQRQTEPAKLTKLVRGELDWIVMKALEKDRNRRYETANGFAMDVQHYLADEPVLAGPPSAGYRLKKFIRRNKGAVLTAVAMTGLMLIGTVVSTSQAVRASRAESQAELQRDLAQENLRKAIRAVDDYFTRISENRLLDVPGLQALRKELLDAALNHYRSFLEDHKDDPSLKAESARAQFRLGDITFATGSQAEALTAFRKARDLQKPLLDLRPDDAALRADLAASHGRIGDVLFSLGGQLNEVLRDYEEAGQLWEALAGEHPNNAEYLSGLATMQAKIGETLPYVGRLADAVEAHERALRFRDDCWRGHPYDLGLQNEVAGSQLSLGLAYMRIDQQELARQSLESSRELRERVIAAHPDVLKYQYDLAHSYRELAQHYRWTDQREKALLLYDKARPILERLVQENFAVTEFHFQLAACFNGIGHTQSQLRRWDEALRAYERARAILEGILAKSPNSLDINTMLASLDTNIAVLKYNARDSTEAIRLTRSSIDRYTRILRDHPRIPQMRYQLGLSHRDLGKLLYFTSRRAEAEESFQAARTVLDQLVRDHPRPMYIASLAGLLLFWPDERMRDPGQAMELTKRVLESSPDGAKGWSLLGAGRYRTGDYQGAIVALKKAMQFSQANAGSDPGIPAPAAESPTPMQMSATPAPFFAIYFAMAHAKLGEPVEARKWYEQALAWWDNHTSPTAEDHQVIAEAAQLLGLPAPTPKK